MQAHPWWKGPSDAHALLTESVMWGHMGQGYVSFTSRGGELERRPDLTVVATEPSTPQPADPDPSSAPKAEPR